MYIVSDEWLLHDLAGEMGAERQATAFRFVQFVLEKCDCFATLDGARFMQKVWNFSKESHLMPAPTRQIAKVFFARVVMNSEKFVRLTREQIGQISQEIRDAAGDDTYLLEVHLSLQGSVIVTTDTRLRPKLPPDAAVEIHFAEDFVREYDPVRGWRDRP